MQLSALRSYCKGRTWEITEEYSDGAWSGKKLVLPALTKLKEDARQHKFDVVVVWKLDRWGDRPSMRSKVFKNWFRMAFGG
jgi:site-specific DNA recombinase